MNTQSKQPSQDSNAYRKKKAFLSQLLTIYGRKPVLEILQNQSINCYRLHLAHSNKSQGIIREILDLAVARKIEVSYHDRQALSRLSKNGKQDQGVCLDVHCPQFQEPKAFFTHHSLSNTSRILAIENVTNPQNLGMIIRSACAGAIDGILLPKKGCARLDSLVIKASAGTLFKAPLILCDELSDTLREYQQQNWTIVGLTGKGTESLANIREQGNMIYLVGNETHGLNEKILTQCDHTVYIPMNNQVESLNVAIAASLVAFQPLLKKI